MLALVLGLWLSTGAFAQEKDTPRPMTWQDIPSWKAMNPNAVKISPDGRFVAYSISEVDGDAELILHDATKNEDIKTFNIGSSTFPMFDFSENSRYFAFKIYEDDKSKKAAAKSNGKGKPDKLTVLNLSDLKETTIDKVTNFSFNNENGNFIAINLLKEGNAGDGKGSDLLLMELSSQKKLNLGNVLEFSFNKPGTHLAYLVDAANKNGNGLYLLQLASWTTQVIDNDEASYKSLSWNEEGDALSLLKFIKDKKYKQEHGIAMGLTVLNAPKLTLVDPREIEALKTSNMTISPNRRPSWSEDKTRLFYGLHRLEKADDTVEKSDKEQDSSSTINRDSLEKVMVEKLRNDASIADIKALREALAKVDTLDKAKASQKAKKNEAKKPDMTIWHWADSRLQSRQQILENQDKNLSYYGMFRLADKQHITLNDSTMKDLNLLPKQHFAMGMDERAYELQSNLDGQNFRDIYSVNLQTGEKVLRFENFYLPTFASLPRSSPDGKQWLYGLEGHFYVLHLESGLTTKLTENIPVSFIDTENDRNVTDPLHTPLGWSADSQFVLLRDGWDIWQVPVSGRGAAINLTVDGREKGIRYQARYVLDMEEKGIDLSKPQYLRMYGEWTKKSGVGRLNASRRGLVAGPEVLLWEDAAISRVAKPKKADKLSFSRENFQVPTELFMADMNLSNAIQVTKNAPDKDKFVWSAGVRLVDYTSDKGAKLQGALFLPANYEEGKKYPTIIYYYEKLSQTLHNYAAPNFSGTGWNPAIYTSNGYAVFIPDIVYTLDDPGMSAVWCVLPAVDEAIKTGVIDENRMGLHGHSWGGYQTSFLITQTPRFKAAAAGAPLTNMISMYDLIYWNTGSGNMSIFEASQGRFRGAPWENWESYERNSPIYHVKQVETPLLMLHNDKDGAVDFTQGIEYYNALRRLQKPVIMVQYKGENHGLGKLENRKDYSVRMLEFFDHFLKGAAAPDWVVDGIPRLSLEEHLEKRAF